MSDDKPIFNTPMMYIRCDVFDALEAVAKLAATAYQCMPCHTEAQRQMREALAELAKLRGGSRERPLE